jgi:hypothetical protein
VCVCVLCFVFRVFNFHPPGGKADKHTFMCVYFVYTYMYVCLHVHVHTFYIQFRQSLGKAESTLAAANLANCQPDSTNTSMCAPCT